MSITVGGIVLSNEQWQALIALHGTPLHEHHGKLYGSSKSHSKQHLTKQTLQEHYSQLET
jgi:hypothetical protein